jgi:phosphoenolpyruvate carboxykinase (ATP)
MANARVPCVAGHPTHIMFLTCDAFGVLPPVSRLTPEQAEYHFISGYTAKVSGTEMGVTEPEATFSACYGAPFLVWHPSKYADMLVDRIRKHNVKVWLVNTGWSGGPYGVGARIKLAYTRAILDAIHAGLLNDAPTQTDPVFGFEIVTRCPNVPSEVLLPRNTWKDKEAYDRTYKKLARLFEENFAGFASGTAIPAG